MIKKIFSIFILCLCTNANLFAANVNLTVDQYKNTIDQHIGNNNEKLRDVYSSLNQFVKEGLSYKEAIKLCQISGLNLEDLSKGGDHEKCHNMVNDLLLLRNKLVTGPACDDKCINILPDTLRKVKYAKCEPNIFSDVQVTKYIGEKLAYEYAKIHSAGGFAGWSSRANITNSDDRLYLTIRHYDNSLARYDFIFDDLNETDDYDIDTGVMRGVCNLYGGSFTDAVGEYDTCRFATKDVDKEQKFNQTAADFGISISGLGIPEFSADGSKIINTDQNVAKMRIVTVSDKESLYQGFGLDPFMFCDMELNAMLSKNFIANIRKTIKLKLSESKIKLEKFKCQKATKKYRGEGCSSRNDDEILTCYINDKPVDFVFDDLSESVLRTQNAALQATECTAVNGIYNGEDCIGLNEEACNKLSKKNAASCPSCSAVKWENGMCTLGSAKSDKAWDDNVELAITIAGIATTVLVTVATAGTGTTVLVGFLSSAGSGIEMGANLAIDNYISEFFKEANSVYINRSKRPIELLNKYIPILVSYQNDMTAAQANAVVEILEDIVNKTESGDFDAIAHKLYYEEEITKPFSNWTEEEIWRAVGIGMQLAGIGINVGTFFRTVFVDKAKQLERLTKIYTKTRGFLGEALERVAKFEVVVVAEKKKVLEAAGNASDIYSQVDHAVTLVENASGG